MLHVAFKNYILCRSGNIHFHIDRPHVACKFNQGLHSNTIYKFSVSPVIFPIQLDIFSVPILEICNNFISETDFFKNPKFHCKHSNILYL